MNRDRPRLRTHIYPKAFTIIEILVVLFIISLLMMVAVPNFSKFVKSSKVQQAAVTVDSALYQARSQAQNNRTCVSVFFGADVSPLGLQMSPTPLPPPGSIEIWGVLASMGGFAGYNGVSPPGVADDGWSPYVKTTKLLMRSPLNYPDGVKIVAGYFYTYQVGSTTHGVFGFPRYRRSPQGEIKRHQTTFSYTGGVAMNQRLTCFNFPYILIYDEATGEHVVMEAGRPQSASRPRILPYQVTDIVYYATNNYDAPQSTGSRTAVTDLRLLPGMIDNYPGND